MTSWTSDEIISWRTCYPDERIRELTAGVERVTPEWVAELSIPEYDRVCLLIRPEAFGERRQLWMLAQLSRRGWLPEVVSEPPNGESALTWALAYSCAYFDRHGSLSFSDQLRIILELYATDA